MHGSFSPAGLRNALLCLKFYCAVRANFSQLINSYLVSSENSELCKGEILTLRTSTGVVNKLTSMDTEKSV